MKTPETIVQEQLDFYNIHDLENFLSMYHDDIKIYNLADNSLILDGKEQLRERYSRILHEAKVHVRLKDRIVMGNKVIDHEEISGPEKDKTIETTVVYEINGEFIRKAWFIFGQIYSKYKKGLHTEII